VSGDVPAAAFVCVCVLLSLGAASALTYAVYRFIRALLRIH